MMKTSRGRIMALMVLAILAVLAAGCSDQGTAPQIDGGGGDGGGGGGGGGGAATVSYAADIQSIWDAACSGCHGRGGNGGLDLRVDVSYGNLVDTPAQGYAGTRVVPGSPAASVLYLKLTGAGGVGGVMPPAGSLDQASLDLINTWITEGALDN